MIVKTTHIQAPISNSLESITGSISTYIDDWNYEWCLELAWTRMRDMKNAWKEIYKPWPWTCLLVALSSIKAISLVTYVYGYSLKEITPYVVFVIHEFEIEMDDVLIFGFCNICFFIIWSVFDHYLHGLWGFPIISSFLPQVNSRKHTLWYCLQNIVLLSMIVFC